MTARTATFLLLTACARSAAPEAKSAPTPGGPPSSSPASSSAPFFECEKAVRKAAEASSSGAAKATVDELAGAAEKLCNGVHEANAAWARKIRDAAK